MTFIVVTRTGGDLPMERMDWGSCRVLFVARSHRDKMDVTFLQSIRPSSFYS